MKLSNVLFLSFSLTLAALGTGCADTTADDDNTETAGQELATAAVGTWEKLGQTTVNGSIDRDTIHVGLEDGRFKSIQIRVEDSSLLMHSIKVVFGNGESFEPNVRWVFNEGTRSREIDLPGDVRFIRRVEFKFSNLPGGGRAQVKLFGKNAAPPPAWQNLGELRVDGTHDRDSLRINDEGRFSAVQIRVKRSPLVMHNMRVTFGNDTSFSPNLRLVFDENTRSRVIDLPGDRRNLKRFDFNYTDLPSGGDAIVQVWAVR